MNLQSSRWASSNASNYNYRRQSPSRPPTAPLSSRATSLPPQDTNAAASSSSATPETQTQHHKASELARHRRLLRRLRWKLPALATSHRLATTVDLAHHHYAGIAPDDVAAIDAARREAELMFKLDWFEYYTLLERALLHLLGVFGIQISRHGGREAGHVVPESSSAMKGEAGSAAEAEVEAERPSIIGTAAYASPYAHRFHANVLASLDLPTNPLHEVLGRGSARASLGRAKELRNRWKDADERAVDVARGLDGAADGSPAPLSSFDTERMLWDIFDGFERALGIAERAVGDAQAGAEGQAGKQAEDRDGDMMMEDAMDWEEL